MAYQQNLQRNAFLKFETGGLPSLKVDTLAVTFSAGQHQVIVRTTDGLLLSLSCEPPSRKLLKIKLFRKDLRRT